MKTQIRTLNLLICGVGGQGNILISKLIGTLHLRKSFFVTIGETFGAAQRGGAVTSSIRISTARQYGPLIPKGRAHIILSLEPLEALRGLCKYGNPSTLAITNSRPISPVNVLSGKSKYPENSRLAALISRFSKRAWFLDATQIAMDLEAPIVTNIVMLGALLGTRALATMAQTDMEELLKSNFPSDQAELNVKALRLGVKAIESQGKAKVSVEQYILITHP